MQNRSRPGAVTGSTGREIAAYVALAPLIPPAPFVVPPASVPETSWRSSASSGPEQGGICYEQGAAADARATAVGVGAGENPSAGTGFVERGRASGPRLPGSAQKGYYQCCFHSVLNFEDPLPAECDRTCAGETHGIGGGRIIGNECSS